MSTPMPDDLRTALLRLKDAAHEALKTAIEEDVAGMPFILRRLVNQTDGLVDWWSAAQEAASHTARMVDETAPKIDPLPAPTLPLAVQEMMALCCRDVAQMTGVSEIAWPDRFDTMDRMRAADAEYRKQGTTLFQAEYMQQPIFDDETAPNAEGNDGRR